MRVNIYDGNRLLETNRFFKSLDNAVRYCKYICPKIYGYTGNYKPIIVHK